MVTIKDVARLANVSTATVSYALNNPSKISKETRERVLKVVKETNYEVNRIAKSLKIKETNTIGIITEDITVFSTPEIIDGIDAYAEENDYHIILENVRLYKKIGNNYQDTSKVAGIISELVGILLSRQVEGIIYVGAHCRDVSGIIGSLPIPIVYVYCYTNEESSFSVNYDDELAAYELINYLLNMGHKELGMITGLTDSMQSQMRLEGCKRAFSEHKVAFNSKYIRAGNWEREGGYQAAKELLSLSQAPTAIFAFNDLMAGGVIDAANEMGLNIPGDISLTGFDNRECSYSYTPQLTTMSLPLSEMGRRSAELLLGLIKKEEEIKDKNQNLKLKCDLVERESTLSLA